MRSMMVILAALASLFGARAARAACGDGTREAGEACDTGPGFALAAGCATDCTCAAWQPECHEVCGNGLVLGGETCDDGNISDGDGCSATCQVEAGWDCAVGSDVCPPPALCGDVPPAGCADLAWCGAARDGGLCDAATLSCGAGAAPELTCDGGDGCALAGDACAVCAAWPTRCARRDADGDGAEAAPRGDDCDDRDPDVYVGAPERCNGVDDDCDGATDDGLDVGTACEAEPGDRCATGLWLCQPDGTRACERDYTIEDHPDPTCRGSIEVVGSGCAGGDAGPGALVLGLVGLLGLVAAGRLRGRARGRAAGVLLALGVAGGASDGARAAGPEGASIELLEPLPDAGTTIFGTAQSRVLPHLGWTAGLTTQLALAPLRFAPTDGSDGDALVDAQVWLDVGGAVGLLGWLDVALDVPLVIGDAGVGLVALGRTEDDVAGAHLGDVRLVPRARIVDGRRGGLGLAFVLPVSLPTGSEAAFTGGVFALEPRAALDLTVGRGIVLALNLGFRWSAERHVYNVGQGAAVTWSLGARVPVGAGVDVLGAVLGRVDVAEGRDPEDLSQPGDAGEGQRPLEAVVGARWLAPFGLDVSLGVGKGLLAGMGASDLRVLLSIGFRAGDLDSDRDGLPNESDPCPLDAEDVDGFEDEDGCPDADDDRDGVVDARDGCVREAEDRDGFEDEDGCPELDDDKDQIADKDDRCPRVAGVREKQGCPWEKVKVTRERLEFTEKVFFDLDRTTIKGESNGLLDEIAEVLVATPRLKKIEVAGHTDSAGTAAHNQTLSEGRAKAVVAYLVSKGVAAERLVAKGYGFTRPLVQPDPAGETEEQAAKNRRVELVILEQVLEEEVLH